jgi:hypothetical protein
MIYVAIRVCCRGLFNQFIMMPIKKPGELPEVPVPHKQPEVIPAFDPEEPLLPEESPEVIPDEDPYETPVIEVPPPGEGP